MSICNNCEGIVEIGIDVCLECGFVFNNQVYDFVKPYEEKINVKSKCITSYEQVSSEDNMVLRLELYMQSFFKELNIEISSEVFNLCIQIFKLIKKSDGSKRTKSKNGIIIYCISLLQNYKSKDLAKSVKLEMKYINNAEKTVLELVHLKKLKIDKKTFINHDTLNTYISLLPFELPDIILSQIDKLTSICKSHDILSQSTPQSMYISCIMYILMLNDIVTDPKQFKLFFNISCVTLFKLKKILKLHSDLFESNGIFKITT
jgi:hypothetical protein